MRTRFIGVALTILALIASAYADAMFRLGRHSPIVPGTNTGVIRITDQTTGFGDPVFGTVNGTNAGDVNVIATSTEDTLLGGNNRITSASGPLACQGNSRCLHDVDLTWPGFGFTYLLINPVNPRIPNSITVTVSLCTQKQTPTGVECVDRTDKTYPPPPATGYGGTTGNNYLTIDVVPGSNEVMTELKIESSGGFLEVRQIEVNTSGVGSGIPDIPDIPEPSSMLLLGSGLLVVTQVLRRKLKLGFGARSA